MGFNSAFKGLNLNFLNKFSKNTQIPNFMKIRPVGAQLFHVDRRTDREANCRFSQFCKGAKNHEYFY